MLPTELDLDHISRLLSVQLRRLPLVSITLKGGKRNELKKTSQNRDKYSFRQ